MLPVDPHSVGEMPLSGYHYVVWREFPPESFGSFVILLPLAAAPAVPRATVRQCVERVQLVGAHGRAEQRQRSSARRGRG